MKINGEKTHSISLIKKDPYYKTRLGATYLGDAFHLLEELPKESVNLIITSPPFALIKKKEYGNVDASDYVAWFLRFADGFRRVLKRNGSFVLDLGGTWNKGFPTRSLYHFELLLNLCRKNFSLAQEFYWFNPAKLPTPAEWVTIRRVRVKDAVNTIWWLSKNANPKANNRKILKPYSDSMISLLKNGYKPNRRPSGHNISNKFQRNNGGAIPPNLLIIPNTDSNSQYLNECKKAGIKPHPARFPSFLPEFFIKFLTNDGDLVLDPFAGSNVTGEVAERLNRRWISFEIKENYIEGSKFRFSI